jgi:hypothetical protein
MSVLKLILGKNMFLQIFLQVQVLCVKRPDAWGTNIQMVKWHIWTVKWHVWTRAVLQRAGMAVIVRTGTLKVLKPHSFPPTPHISVFFLLFGILCDFARAFSRVLSLLCHLLYYLSILGIVLYLLYSFQFILTVRIFSLESCCWFLIRFRVWNLMGASLFKTLTVDHHSSSTQFVPRLLCVEEIFTLQLPSLAVGIGSSIFLSLSKKRLLFRLYYDYSLLYSSRELMNLMFVMVNLIVLTCEGYYTVKSYFYSGLQTTNNLLESERISE